MTLTEKQICIRDMHKELERLKAVEKQKKYRLLNYQRIRMLEKEDFYEWFNVYIREQNKSIVTLFDI